MIPSVSIVLPTYNRAAVISKSIDCILEQTYTDFELIIADDCSTDGTKDILTPYLAHDPRIRYVRLPQNSGAAAARNFGAANARGKYLAFQDSDDIWDTTKLQKQMDYLAANPHVSAVFTSFLSIDAEKTILQPPTEHVAALSTHIFNNLLVSPLIAPPTLLLKREVFGATGGFLEELRSHEDYEYSLRLARDYEIGFIQEPLLRSYHYGSGVNSNYHEILKTNFYILNLYREWIAADPVLEAKQLERLFYYTLLGNEGQYFFDELASYVLATGHRDLYYQYESLYNQIREGNLP